MKKRATPEFALQCAVHDYLRLQYPRLLYFAVPNGEKRTRFTGARLKRMGVRAGVADILVFWLDPITHVFRGAALELKAGKNPLEPTQEVFLYDWVMCGGHYALIRSLDDLKKAFSEWQVPRVIKCPDGNALGAVLQQYVKPTGRKRGGV